MESPEPKKDGKMHRGLKALALAAGLLAPVHEVSGKATTEFSETTAPEKHKAPKPDQLKEERAEKEEIATRVLFAEFRQARREYQDEREKMTRLQIDDAEKFETIERQADPAGVDEHSSMRALSQEAALKMLIEIEKCLDILTPIVERRGGGSFIDKYPVTVRGTMRHAIDLWKEFQAIEDSEAKDAAMAGIVRFLIFKNEMKKDQEKAFDELRTEEL